MCKSWPTAMVCVHLRPEPKAHFAIDKGNLKMTHWKKCGILIISAAFIAGCAEMNTVFESQGITARKGLMRSNSKNFKAVRAAAKAGNGAAMAKAAKALYKSAGKIKKAYAKKDMQGVTRAKPAIWKNKSDFNQKADNLAASAAVLAQVWAKSGNKAQIGASLKRIGKSCGACHTSYRAKKKK